MRPYPNHIPHLIVSIVTILAGIHARAVDMYVALVPVADTGLYEIGPSNNLGAVMEVPAGVHSGARRSRYLLKFDIANALPGGARIVVAELRLQVGSAGSPTQTYQLHRMLRSWEEGNKGGNNGGQAGDGETTWLAQYHPTTLWATPGGSNGVDYTTMPTAAFTLGGNGSTNDVVGAALASDVQLWLDQPSINFGWMLRAVDETASQTVRRIRSRETVTNSPVLTVRYQVDSTEYAANLVYELIAAVNQSDLRHKHPLLATLAAALASIERGSHYSATGQLVAFQNKVAAQSYKHDPDFALELILRAEELIAALEAGN